jgi:D-arabinose 1-dehydrogenase-like Zn-dependent alcohol dehydrogenase
VGGLGHLGVQYATALGADVVAVTSSGDKRDELAALGAGEVVVADADAAGRELERIGGVDVILHTGNRVGADIVRGLRNYGRLSFMGVSESVVQTTPREAIFKKIRIMGSSQGPRRRLHEALELHARSGATTKVEAYSLDAAQEAYDRVRSGLARYRAVLVPV